MRSLIILTFFCFFLSSCKKEKEVVKTTPVDTKNIFPNNVVSDSRGEYYIEAEFNGKKLCMSPTTAPRDTFSNAYYFITETMNLDQLNLIRMNNERSAQMQIYFGQSTMITRPIPYILPHANLAFCEFTQFQFYDERQRHGTENAPNDDYTYQGTTNTGMSLRVNSFYDNIIEGTFEGTLKTNTGKTLLVKNGAFRIKIIIVNHI